MAGGWGDLVFCGGNTAGSFEFVVYTAYWESASRQTGFPSQPDPSLVSAVDSFSSSSVVTAACIAESLARPLCKWFEE